LQEKYELNFIILFIISMSKLTTQAHHLKRRFPMFVMALLSCFYVVSGYGQTAIDLSRPVGMTAGEAGSNGAGAATYSIPINIPAGVKGVQPGISISYSSQGSGNGFSGHGWSLSGISMITRAGKNVFHNGIATPVNYTGANDAFVMDGQRLMLISGTNGAAGSTYGTEQESFSKIEATGGNGNSPDWFKVTTKNGTILEYGSDNSKLKTNDGNNVILWLLRRVKDASDNYMEYNYSIDNTNRYYSLSSVTYTGNTNTGTQASYKVVFTYTTKTDYQSCPLYIAGSSVYSAKILDRIDVRKLDDTQISSYAFAYQYRQKKYFLTSVTEAGSDGTTLNPITFTYGENTTANDVWLTSENGYATDRNYTGDFDGDGRTDIQSYGYTINTSTGETWYKSYQIYDYNVNTIGGKYRYDIAGDIPSTDIKVMGKDAAQNPFAVSDFDGDGKEDVLLAKFNTNSYRLKGININYSRVNAGFNPGDKYDTCKKVAYDNLPTSQYGQHTLWKQGGSFFASGDFDGDGHLDYILILAIHDFFYNDYKAFLSTPSKNIFNREITNFGQGVNGASGDFAANAIAESKAIIPVNFDGDGKTELLVVRNEGSYVLSIFPNAVTPPLLPTYGSSILYFTPDIKTDYKIFPGDFNGDGNTDLFVRASKNVPSTPWKVFLSTGKAFTQSAFVGAYTIILPGDGYSNAHMLSVGDYDGDGKSDIMHSLDLSGSSSNHVFYYFNGTSFTYEINGLSQSTNTQSMYSGGDFNGDGKADLLKVRNVSSTSFMISFLMAKPFKEQNLLVGASNLGFLTSFDYKLLNGKDNIYPLVYNRTEGEYSYNDAGATTPHIPDYIVPAPAIYVLSKIVRPNGLVGSQTNENYSYEDLVVHPSGRGFLGFKKTDVSNDMGVVNRVWSTVNLPYSMLLPDVTQTHLNSGGMFIRSRFTTSFKQVSVSSNLNRRFFMRQDRVFTHNWLTNESSEALNTYDDYGNVTKSVVNVGVSDDFNITSTIETATTTTAYATYAGAAYPGFPTSTTTSKTRTGPPQVSKTTSYTYTPQGLPQTVTENTGTPIATTVTNTYNGFGLPTQTTTSAPGVTTPVINYVYDTKGQFLLEKKITGAGITKKETATYDERWQVPLSKTSTDGLTTTYQYDNFGVLKQTNFPDGNSAVTTKSWETSGNARYSLLSQRPDGSNPVKVYMDLLGKDIRTEKRGFNNQLLISEKFYDNYGRISFESTPYYASEQINYTYYDYDNYSRLISTTNPTGKITTTYSNTGGVFTVKTSNIPGQWTSKTTDASGKIIASSDNGVGMSVTYDSWGNQLTAGSNGKIFVTNVYDNYGRKQSTTDVNAGTISYQYNSLGQITQQTDAKGQTQTTNYDAFGRASQVTGPQGATTYTYYYDAASQKSNDNIAQITGFSGDVRTYQYDNLQRLSSESMTITGGSNLSKSYTYDAHGNLATTTYPAGFLIRNVYDNNDILTGTKYEQGTTVKNLFTATAMNSRGIYTGYSTGNGKTKTVTYDFTKEVATRYYTAGVQDLNLVYEANTFNLLSRKDAIRNLTETFTYDINDRLTNAKVNGVQQFAIIYDAGAQGKILQKTDIGNYRYDAQKVHQLKYLTPISGGADPGTIIGSNVRDITYTQFLKTATITENNYLLTYSYGSDQQRLTSELKQNGTVVETKIYWGDMEKMTKGSNNYEIYYIPGGNGLNNIIVKQNSTINIYYAYTDHLGSITAVTNEAGTIVAEQNFDAWGRKRNPANWTYTGIPTIPDWLYRGFTGHEHLAAFNLINMNGRMYDPMTGMMMSPDNYIPMPWSPGGYNRYGYADGNPLKFVDPDGNFLHIIIGAVIGGVVNLTVKAFQGDIHNFWDGVKAFGVGAVAGGAAAATGGAALAMTGLSATSVAGGAIAGFAGSTVGSPILGVGNNIFFGDPYSAKQFGKDVIVGTAFGAVAGGIGAAIKGKNIWLGNDVAKGRNIFSFNNKPIYNSKFQVSVGPTVYDGWSGDDGKLITEFAGNKIGQTAGGDGSLINQSSKAVLQNGYYEVNGFKFSQHYYNKLWATGRGAPSLTSKMVLEGGANTAIPDTFKDGFYKYIYGGWEMIYNPVSKEVWHLQPIR
jgi:RHS repeat-associated protein